MTILASVIIRDTRANQSGYESGLGAGAGALYYVTDEGVIERWNGSTWDSYSGDFDSLSPLTTEGDVLYRNSTVNARLGIGTAGQVLTVNSGATAPEWADGGDVVGPGSATDDAIALFDGTTGKLIKDSAVLISTDDTLASDSDSNVPTEQAVKAYVDGKGGDGTDADAFGFRGVPQNAQSGNYTLVAADSGKHIYHASGDGAGDTYTIPANASVAFEVGTAVTFVNMSSDTVDIAITSDTMYLAGDGTTGTRTLAQYGVATAIKTGTTEWVISGSGLT